MFVNEKYKVEWHKEDEWNKTKMKRQPIGISKQRQKNRICVILHV